MADLERRYTPVPVQVRADGDRKRIGGYASVFDKLSRNLGGFVEVVNRSFFNTTRANGWPDVVCRYNHDDNMLLGTTGGRTLDLALDETGLLYEVDPPLARADIVELVGRGDVRKSSFAFRVDMNGDEWATTDQGYPLRRLLSGQLVDVAPVNSPAYDDTSAGMRSDVALRSLAERMHAPLDDVRRLAQADELRKFFIRTDNKGQPASPRMLGAAAAIALMARQEDPYV